MALAIERKKADQEVKRQRQEMRTIFDSVPALIFYKDIDSFISNGQIEGGVPVDIGGGGHGVGIAGTSAQLKTQGVAIQKQASDTQLNIETLKKAFADINSVIPGGLDEFNRSRAEDMALAARIFDSSLALPGVSRVRLNASPARRIASATVG